MLKPTPASLYLAQLSSGSQGLRQCLDKLADLLDPDHDADSYPWETLTYGHTVALRMELVARYRPRTVNKMLSTLRGVLKQTWRLGLIDSDTYHRAASVENVKSSDLLSGRALSVEEITALFKSCAEDSNLQGIRDAALLAVLYGGGLRRGELASLDLAAFDPEDGSIRVTGKGRKQRTVYLPAPFCLKVDQWIEERGTEAGPLFCAVDQQGLVRLARLRGESISYILKRRAQKAGVDSFSAHDLRRTTLTLMLDAGVDVLTVQRVAGHVDPSTTSRYDRRGEQAKRQAVLRLPV